MGKGLFFSGSLIIALIIFSIPSCTNRKLEVDLLSLQLDEACYPDDIGTIFITRCAVTGCHNTESKEACGGLDMSSWEKLFNGARAGAAVIPFRSDQSFLMNFINTDSSLGPVQKPTMPYDPSSPGSSVPLSASEVLLIKNWIDQGAPDCNGNIPFSGDPARKKIYVTNQGCDLVAVLDAEKKVVMRYINVGGDQVQVESPHNIKVSPDGQGWYVSFVANNASKFQKFNTSDDSFVSEVDISPGSWNTFAFSPDAKTAYVVDFSSTGRVAVIDCENMTKKDLSPFPNPFSAGVSTPHGSAVSPDGNCLYLTKQLENGLYKFNLNDFPDGQDVDFGGAQLSNPHELAFAPDGSNNYFVTCLGTNEVKAYNYQPYPTPDIFIVSIPVAASPLELAFSNSTIGYLLVTCSAGNAVSIINYHTNSFVKTITGFYSPHGIAVDDGNKLCYVANRNLASSGGPPPHHTSSCGGRNGFLQAIDLITLEKVPGFKHELSVDPYSIAVRK